MTSPQVLGGSLLMVGCGNMGRAMLDRWLANGLMSAQVTVVSPSGRPMPAGVTVVRDVTDAGPAETILLALKPQQIASLRTEAFGVRTPDLLLSILAGAETATLAGLCQAGSVVRAMPNLPVGIGKGVVALHGADDDAGARSVAAALMAPLGLVEWIEREDQFDAVTALAGCGPGFVFRFIDALAAAGAALGLDPALADRLARATVAGAGAMAEASPDRPAVLADRVASPGGSTREGLNVLDRDAALARLLRETLAAAAARNREMAEAARSR